MAWADLFLGWWCLDLNLVRKYPFDPRITAFVYPRDFCEARAHLCRIIGRREGVDLEDVCPLDTPAQITMSLRRSVLWEIVGTEQFLGQPMMM